MEVVILFYLPGHSFQGKLGRELSILGKVMLLLHSPGHKVKLGRGLSVHNKVVLLFHSPGHNVQVKQGTKSSGDG